MRFAGPGGGEAAGRPRFAPWESPRALQYAIAISLAVHAYALTLHFKMPDAFALRMPPQLEVVLVNAKTATKPKDPQVLAQANLDRGGTTEDDRRAKTPAPVLPHADRGDEAKRAAKRVQELEAKQKQLLAQAKSKQTVAAPDPEPKPVETPQPTVSGTDLAASALAIARMEAQIARQVEEYNKRPRKAFVGARAAEVRYAQYVEDWRQKIERVGTLNYPSEARGKIYGNLQVTVEINADGTLRGVQIDRPSGQRVLDRAAERIVNLAAPFAAFPPDVRKDTDILVITRTWTFAPGDKLQSD